MRRKNSLGAATTEASDINNFSDKKYSKYQVFSLPDDSPGIYLGAINQTLRVVDVPSGDERRKNALQYLVDQHPARLLIMPDGEHKKSKATTLAKIAPNRVPSGKRKNSKKRQSNTNLQGAHFLKKAAPVINGLQTPETPFFEKSRSH